MKQSSVSKNHVGRWWHGSKDQRVICSLCPRYCNIPVGSHGFCYVRKNVNGKLITTAYGRSTGFAVDPIEKKPLYHFYPGSDVLSFGTIGCNLGCKFCQNWHISKNRNDRNLDRLFTPAEVVQIAIDNNCLGIAYTYNDPIIFGEWVIDIAVIARANGLKNVLVTNGFITSNARADIFTKATAINVDLKAFESEFYRKLTLSHLEPVLDTLRWLVHETDIWIEITTLLIPEENDSAKELNRLTNFIAEELNVDIPLHFSAFHPDFKLRDRPRTPVATLEKAYSIAKNNGLNHVYLGNINTQQGQDTYCSQCGAMLIQRNYYQVGELQLDAGQCRHCGHQVPGCFKGG